MALLAIELNELTPIVNVLHDGLFQVQLAPELVKISDLQIGTTSNLTRGGLQLPKNQLEKRRFTRAIFADQTDSVSPHDHPGIAPDDFWLAWIGKAHLLRFHNELSRLTRFLQANPGLALLLTPPGTLHSQTLQGTHPTLVAGTTGFDPLPDPGFLLGKLFIEQGVITLFLSQQGLFSFQETIIVTGPRGKSAPIQLQQARRH